MQSKMGGDYNDHETSHVSTELTSGLEVSGSKHG